MGIIKNHKEKKKITKDTNNNIKISEYGTWIFGIGILIILISSFLNLSEVINKIILGTLIIFGIIIGFLNIRDDEAIGFLVATISLVILTGPFLGMISQNFIQHESFAKIFGYLIALIVPASIIVSFKLIFITAKDE